MRRLFAVLLFVMSGLSAQVALAQPAPSDQAVILTVDGAVKGKTDWTRAEIEALGLVTIQTKTPWHDGVQTFEGVPLDKLMQALGAKGTKVNVIALNRYAMEIPISDFAAYGAILATRRNGTPMAVRDKGPLFVIYPYDSVPDLQTETYYGRSVWQVRTITVE